ncbi:MAG: response regulator, partial [Candidatus Fermentibacterota bacterium]
RSQGYTVFAVSSGAEALELLRGFRGTIDLLLTDIIMPDMDGTTLYAEVRQIGPDIRVLYMSGYTRDVISSRRPMEDGAGFLQKPFTLKTLAGMVRRVLDA